MSHVPAYGSCLNGWLIFTIRCTSILITFILQEAPSKRYLPIVGIFSLFITYAANTTLAFALPHSVGIGSSCIASATAELAIYLAIRPRRPLGWPISSTPWRRVFRLSITWLALWLAAAGAVALARGYWQAYVAGSFTIIGFVFLGPLGEEFLFRGALFELTERAYPASRLAPILVSSFLFSAYHLQIHGFKVTPFVVVQLVFTLPMGVIFGMLRSWSGSLWPAFVLHVLTNLPFVFGATNGATAPWVKFA
jgi:membrane protease YdiL (CAAX protease family)